MSSSWLLRAACRLLRIPELPTRPHGYFAVPDKFIEVEVPGAYPRPLRVRYKETGHGRPLLLVHGLQTSSYSWRYNLQALAAHRRVFAPDLIGSGLSDHPADFSYSPEGVADFLHAFIRAVEAKDRAASSLQRAAEPWDVVGNSLGGGYVAALAARHPESVRRLVIIHAPGFMTRAPVFGLEQMRRGRVPRFFARLFGPWMVIAYQKYHRPGILSGEEIAQYSLPYRDADGRTAFWRVVREGLGPEVAARLPETLARIQAPTLLLWARNDKLIPPWTGEHWAKALPHAAFEWVEDSSHFPHVEHPEQTTERLLRFLDSSRAATA